MLTSQRLCYLKFSCRLFTCLFSIPPTASHAHLDQEDKFYAAGPLSRPLLPSLGRSSVNTQQALDK